MNPSYYKYCIVPQCKSSTTKTPNKLFIYVPNNKKMRQKWLTIARKHDAGSFSTYSRMYFCEDHFDLPNDMVNYMEYRVMGKVSQIRMKPGCIPRKFECQEDRRKRTCGNTKRPFVLKKQRQMIISECLKEPEVLPEELCAPSSSDKDTSTYLYYKSRFKMKKMPETDKFVHTQKANKSGQVIITPNLRSKANQTKHKLRDQALSPLKPKPSPFKATNMKSKPSITGLIKITRNIILIKEEQSDSDISLYKPPSEVANSRSPSLNSLQIKSSSECSELITEDKKQEEIQVMYLS